MRVVQAALLLVMMAGCAGGNASRGGAPAAPGAQEPGAVAPSAVAPSAVAPNAVAPGAPDPAGARKEFSMRMYYVAFLRRGPAWSAARTPEATRASEGHMANIQRLAACGKLLIAGPFEVGENAPPDALAGIFIFDVATREEAVALTESDPAVQAGRFVIEVMPWYGPAGLTYDGHVPPAPGTPCAAPSQP